MRVLCGGEDGVMGVYLGELMPDVRSDAKNRLVRVDGIKRFPGQRAIITHSIYERLPLPFGAVVRMRIIGPTEEAGAVSEEQYGDMLEAALEEATEAHRRRGDYEVWERLRKRRRLRMTGVSGAYAKI